MAIYEFKNKLKVRDSQFELLRIIAIFFVIIHHLVIKGASTVGYVEPYSIQTCGYAGALLNSFVVGGGEFVCTYYWVVWYEKCI